MELCWKKKLHMVEVTSHHMWLSLDLFTVLQDTVTFIVLTYERLKPLVWSMHVCFLWNFTLSTLKFSYYTGRVVGMLTAASLVFKILEMILWHCACILITIVLLFLACRMSGSLSELQYSWKRVMHAWLKHNPLVCTAARTVYSLGGCMHKGVTYRNTSFNGYGKEMYMYLYDILLPILMFSQDGTTVLENHCMPVSTPPGCRAVSPLFYWIIFLSHTLLHPVLDLFWSVSLCQSQI